jgi:hypothetical protein
LSQDLGDSRRDFEIQNSIIKTWKLSLDQISRQKLRATELFSLMSVLDRQGIPKTRLSKDNKRGVDFTTALGTLQAFSLIGIERGGTNYEMHPQSAAPVTSTEGLVIGMKVFILMFTLPLKGGP